MLEKHCIGNFGISLLFLSIAFVAGHQDAAAESFMATNAASGEKQLDIAMDMCLEEKHEESFRLFSSIRELFLKEPSISQVHDRNLYCQILETMQMQRWLMKFFCCHLSLTRISSQARPPVVSTKPKIPSGP